MKIIGTKKGTFSISGQNFLGGTGTETGQYRYRSTEANRYRYRFKRYRYPLTECDRYRYRSKRYRYHLAQNAHIVVFLRI